MWWLCGTMMVMYYYSGIKYFWRAHYVPMSTLCQYIIITSINSSVLLMLTRITIYASVMAFLECYSFFRLSFTLFLLLIRFFFLYFHVHTQALILNSLCLTYSVYLRVYSLLVFPLDRWTKIVGRRYNPSMKYMLSIFWI